MSHLQFFFSTTFRLHNCNKKVFFCFSFVETVHQLLLGFFGFFFTSNAAYRKVASCFVSTEVKVMDN